ncbi:MAG: 4Fe-4S dicluster domain-containing protein [Clostridia bacterium]|nr:4Fe-4S dicluster domain-containing protein [Clostridia bacterium]
MNKFDTKIQELKYEVLKELIRSVYEGNTEDIYTEIPKKIVPGPKATMRCCIYKERAILQERIRMAKGGSKSNPNVIEVIDEACDECPVGGIYVTPACRGCLNHMCYHVCPKGAITVVHNKPIIDRDKCIECGKCVQACPYNAIIHQQRPCMMSCKVKAISMNEEKKARIDFSKCIMCGACVYQCPFGAIQDKSYILDCIDLLKKSENNTKYKVHAVIAPAIVSQFKYAAIEQVITGIRQLGFHQVTEAALGADIVLYHEAKEFKEKGVMTTSCCPSFVMFVEKNFPELRQYISSSNSPMVEAAKLIKRTDPTAKVVFIGPCTSKKMEFRMPKTEGAVDCVISFEELQAFLDARDVDVTSLEGTPLDNASYYGRIFAKSCGIAQGIKAVGETMGVTDVRPIAMSGIDQCRMNLLKLKMGKAAENFFEGMACDGGCINGALCLHHGMKNMVDVDKYGQSAKEKNIEGSVKLYKMSLLSGGEEEK